MKNQLYKDRRNEPKPIGKKPMTAAERKRRSRLKLKSEGGKEYQIIIHKEEMALIKVYAETFQLDSNKALNKLFKEARDHISNAMTNAIEMNQSGLTNNDIIQYLQTNLFPKPVNSKGGI